MRRHLIIAMCATFFLAGCSKVESSNTKNAVAPSVKGMGLFGERIGETIKGEAFLKNPKESRYEIEKPLVEIVGFKSGRYWAELDKQGKIKALSFSTYTSDKYDKSFREVFNAVISAIERKYGKVWSGRFDDKSTSDEFWFFSDGASALVCKYHDLHDEFGRDRMSECSVKCQRLVDLIDYEVGRCRICEGHFDAVERNLKQIEAKYPADVVKRILDAYEESKKQKDFL